MTDSAIPDILANPVIDKIKADNELTLENGKLCKNMTS